MRGRLLKQVKRLVVKVGSSLVASRESGLRPDRIERLAEDIAVLKRGGRAVLLVSSGAIVSGIKKLGLPAHQEPPRQAGGGGRRPEPPDVGL